MGEFKSILPTVFMLAAVLIIFFIMSRRTSKYEMKHSKKYLSSKKSTHSAIQEDVPPKIRPNEKKNSQFFRCFGCGALITEFDLGFEQNVLGKSDPLSCTCFSCRTSNQEETLHKAELRRKNIGLYIFLCLFMLSFINTFFLAG